MLTRAANSGQSASTVVVLVGPRGLGKTVMLDVISDEAVERALLPVHVALDSESDGARLLAGRLVVAADRLSDSVSKAALQAVRARLRKLSVEVNLGVVKVVADPMPTARARATTAREQLAALLVSTAELAVSGRRRGLAVFIDEIQQATRADLVVVVNALQDALRTARAPIVVFAAGLPNAPDRVVDAASFGERFEYRRLEPLSSEQSERALLEPALQHGVTWEPDAVRLVLNEAKGSPYLLQLFGDEAWLIADPRPEDAVSHEQAEAALREAWPRVHDGIFRSRWSKTTGAERQFLLAVAEVADTDGVAESRDYGAVLGRTAQQLSTTRESLIDKGVVESAGRGRLRFTIAGFREYVLERTGSD